MGGRVKVIDIRIRQGESEAWRERAARSPDPTADLYRLEALYSLGPREMRFQFSRRNSNSRVHWKSFGL